MKLFIVILKLNLLLISVYLYNLVWIGLFLRFMFINLVFDFFGYELFRVWFLRL